MAGSLDYFLYKTDIGTGTANEFKWLILKRDESSSEQTGGLQDTTANRTGKVFAVAGVDFLKIIPRYVLAEGKLTDGTIIRRKFTVFDTSNAVWLGTGDVVDQVATGGDTSQTVTFKPVFLSGEKRSLAAPGTDTGQTDGDVQ